MNIDCNNKNPLQRSGVNQYERVLQALLPDHAKVDERDFADMILFAKHYASQLKYFNSFNDEDGDWQVFMNMDVSVTLASLMKVDVRRSFAYVKSIFDSIALTENNNEPTLQVMFKSLFDFGFSLTTLLNRFYTSLPDESESKLLIGNAIKSELQEYFDRLKTYYEGAKSLEIIDDSVGHYDNSPPIEITPSHKFVEKSLDPIWFAGSLSGFTARFNGASKALQIKNTSTHNLFTSIFDQYSKTLANIVDHARTFLDKTLSNFPVHSPHYGLFLTFIKLFRRAQDHLNKFSKQHLDLYYKEILQLKNANAQPDKVHLIFELAKGVENHLARRDTVYKAGKDVDGIEIFYSLMEDVVLNRGAVRSLKSIFVRKDLSQDTLQVFANPVANSEDGQGAKLLTADKSWLAFREQSTSSVPIGFIVASDYLYLTEGIRSITFSFYAQAGAPVTFTAEDVASVFTLQLSGLKGWVDVPIFPSGVIVASSKEYFTLSVVLDGGSEAIVPYSQKIHHYNFATTLPVGKFTVNNAILKEGVWNFGISKIDISVDVRGMKNLSIENDTGTVNAAKPFDLFGSAPRPGSTLIMGSKELFMKAMEPKGMVHAEINLTWDNYTDLENKITSDETHKVDVYHLQNSLWESTQSNLNLFQDADRDAGFITPADMLNRLDAFSSKIETRTPILSDIGLANRSLRRKPGTNVLNYIKSSSRLMFNIPQLEAKADYTENESYSVKSIFGFLKVELNTDFGHESYPQRLADAARNAKITSVRDESDSNKTTTTVTMNAVEAPYTPRVKEISVDYTATTSIDLALEEEGAFMHLTPFGSKDLKTVTDRTLLPDVNNEGELFIGIGDFITDQTLSILFQVAEGTADPLSVKQELDWYFLSVENQWIRFNREDIIDETNDLTQSGIINFNIPDKASNINTLMSEKLHWLRATVTEKTSSVCKLIQVTAQAAKAQFTDFKRSGNYFKNALPANTISKPVISEAAIKKISQPHASFKGRVKEKDDHFYVRVSERLRHKNRGVGVWDYERMVLEAYPEIFKVKCINHTQVREKTSANNAVYVDNELKPGYVLVVPIPDLKGKNAFDPLRPNTNLGLLAEIKKYLLRHVSPHVNLDIRNPRFEEIQMEFDVKFATDDNAFYRRELKAELEQFLAPWAFDPQTDIEFGGKISKSIIIDFIEERPYVDFLACVKMYQIVEGIKSQDADEAIATSARSVFVSVKGNDLTNGHKISFISDKCDC